MKEIRMDFESYEKEIQDANSSARRWALCKIADWLEGESTLESCLFYDCRSNDEIDRIAIALKREGEFTMYKSKSVKKEVAA